MKICIGKSDLKSLSSWSNLGNEDLTVSDTGGIQTHSGGVHIRTCGGITRNTTTVNIMDTNDRQRNLVGTIADRSGVLVDDTCSGGGSSGTFDGTTSHFQDSVVTVANTGNSGSVVLVDNTQGGGGGGGTFDGTSSHPKIVLVQLPTLAIVGVLFLLTTLVVVVEAVVLMMAPPVIPKIVLVQLPTPAIVGVLFLLATLAVVVEVVVLMMAPLVIPKIVLVQLLTPAIVGVLFLLMTLVVVVEHL